MTIHGAKKGSSKPRQPIIAPDSAQSKTYINILYGLGEGEIAGLADGYKSVYLDDTPLQNDNGKFNFPNIKVDFRSGTNDQTYIDGFPDVSSETAVNVELKHGTPWVKSFNNLDLDALRIRLKWGALRSQNADNGDVSGVKIDYAIDVKTDNGGWVQALATSINAKTSSNYERSHRIDLPPAQTGWQVRVRRITPNSTSDFVSDKMYVSAITEVIDLKLRYPNTALLGLRYDAESFSNVAKMSARCKGLIIKVPTNYDPVARTYDGLWDGTFKRAYTNNPAWVYYDLCTAERYGLGERLTSDMIDKWSLYRLAQYCDEMVDDGMGGQEPRFTVNVYIQSAEGAFEVLSKLAGVFRAISYWDGNSIVVDADIPQDSMYSFSRANVIDGVFEYSGTRARDRHTVAKVAWSNPANHFKTEYEYVRDEKAIAKFGVRVADISAWGCTSKGQAQRAGLWALKSEQLETRMVTFKVGLDGYIPAPAKVIEISDELFAGRANGGRVLAINTKKTVITLDRPITANVGDTLVINGDDGVSQRRLIKSINGDKVTVTKSFTNISVENVWVLDSADLATMKFRVLSVTADDNHQFTITAVQYNPAKYDAIDTGAYIDERPISVINPTVQAPTKSVNLSSYTQVNQGVNVTTLVISWEQVTGAVKYAVEWRKDNSNWQTLPPTGTNSIEISGVYAGQYEAKVTAISAFGQASLATHSSLTEIQGKTGRPTKLAKLTVQGVLFGMELSWLFGAKSEDTNFTEIQVSPDGRSNITTLGTFAYPTNSHTINGLQGNLTQYYRARIVDKLGNTSDWTAWVRGTSEAQADKVLDLISGQISQSHLDASLRTPIGKILPLEQRLGQQIGKIGSLENAVAGVNGQLGTLNQSLSSAQNNIATTQRELNTTKQQLATAQNKLNTAVANITTERNRINTAIRDIGALQSANTAKTQEIANLVQTVGNHTSSIRELGVTTGELAQKYSQLKTASDTANSEITAIKQTQAGQATSIERMGARFDNLAVGGKNLLRATDDFDSRYWNFAKHTNETAPRQVPADGIITLMGEQAFWKHWYQRSKQGTVANSDNATNSLLNDIVDGKEYTLSYEARGDVQLRIFVRLYYLNGITTQNPIFIRQDITSEWARYGHTFTVNHKDGHAEHFNHLALLLESYSIGTLQIRKIKLERGNVATDWTQAPEDVQANIDTAKTETLANINTVHETLTNADIALGHRIDDVSAEFKQADNTIKASVQAETQARTNADNAIAQNVNALQSDYNNNKSSVASQIKTLSDKDKSTASQISQITANVTTAQQTANTANSKADTATTKADDGIRRANTASNKADTANTNAQNAKRVADDALGKATQAKADIITEQKARADGDGSLARQMSALDSKFTNADNAIKASVAQAQQTATNAQQALATAQNQLNAKIDGISVGGRNYLEDTMSFSRNKWYHHSHKDEIGKARFIKNPNGIQIIGSIANRWKGVFVRGRPAHSNTTRTTDSDVLAQLKIGQTYTMSFEAKANVANETLLFFWREYRTTNGTTDKRLKSSGNKDTLTCRLSTQYQRFVKTFTLHTFATNVELKDHILMYFSYEGNQAVHIRNMKLELGNQPTDYTPAPEDMQADIDSKASTASLDEFKSVQATKDQATASRITALDTAYKQADTQANAKIDSEITARTSGDSALSSRLDSLRSEFNGNKASIDAQLRTLSEKDKATAQQLSQFGASLSQKADAATLNNLTTKVNQVEGRLTAEASKYSTLQTTVGQHTASIQMVMQSVDGLKSQWTMKVESGGVVAGIGLASSNGKSRFAIRADVFDIVSPDGTKRPMFSVLTAPQTINGVLVQKGSYFDTAFIAHGSINMLHIADSIQSNNYVQGRSGWRLFKNGTIEINSTFGDGTKIQLTSRGLVGFYANGRKAFELGHFL